MVGWQRNRVAELREQRTGKPLLCEALAKQHGESFALEKQCEVKEAQGTAAAKICTKRQRHRSAMYRQSSTPFWQSLVCTGKVSRNTVMAKFGKHWLCLDGQRQGFAWMGKGKEKHSMDRTVTA